MSLDAQILLADADEASSNNLLGWLESEGFVVSIVNTRRAALNQLKKRFFDVALVDAAFILDDDAAMARWMKARRPGIELIALADYSSEEMTSSLVRLDLADYLPRPCPGRALVVQTIRRTIERRAISRELFDLKRKSDVTGETLESTVVEKRYVEHILESMADGVVATDAQGTIRMVNRALMNYLGYRNAELVGRQIDFMFPRGADEQQVNEILAAVRTRDVSDMAVEFMTKDGDTIPVSLNSSVMRNSDGAVVGIVAAARDEREMQRLIAEAEAATKAKSRFLANMSHEIRTPMNAVLGLAHVLLQTELSDVQRQYVEVLKTSGHGLVDILDDILDFSKVESDKLELENISFGLEHLLSDVVKLLAPTASQQGVTLELLPFEGVPKTVRGDPTRLRQVVTNLISNALKFTDDGFVRVFARCQEVTEDGVIIRCEVSDTGIGIKPEILDKLFQSFSQADTATTRKYGGTGLGLAISKRLVGLMDGTMGVESVPGEGSTFWFTAKVGADRDGQTVPVLSPRELKGMRVLIVDDHAENLDLLDRQLHRIGMTVDRAMSGQEALAEMTSANTGYHLVMIDLVMPGMNGVTLATAISQNPAFRDVALLMMTAHPGRGQAAEARKAGFDGYATKPLSKAELYECIGASIARRRYDQAGPLITRHELDERRDGSQPVDDPEEQPNQNAEAVAKPPAAAAAESPQGNAGDDTPRKDVHILLVDDQKVNQFVARALLKNYSVHCASSGKEAIAASEERRFDLVFMDCEMPEMDGFETTRQIRSRQGASSQTPIIALTASVLGAAIERCLVAGMNGHVAKPIEPEALFKAMDSWIGVTISEDGG